MWCRRCYYRCNNIYNDINLDRLEELKKQVPDLVLLDVRSPQEYKEGHIQGSICIPSYDIYKMAEKILPDKKITIVAYCEYGGRSRKAVNMLKQMGYENVFDLRKS